MDYYKVAFTHRSCSTEIGLTKLGPNNERLEFLGDAIIGSVISEALFYRFPDDDEGTLTRIKSSLVSRKQLNSWAKAIGLPDFLRYDTSLDTNQQFSEDLYGNAFEAFIGAIFLDRGYSFSRKYLTKRILSRLVDFGELYKYDDNHKSMLIEWGQKHKKAIAFELIDKYEDYAKMQVFCVGCWVEGKKMGDGQAYRKKLAEQEAARQVLLKVSQE